MRTRTSKTVADHGQYVTTVSAGSLNYDSSGSWQPIDNTLVPSTDSGYAWQNKANRYAVRFPSDIGGGPVHIESGASWANFRLVGASGSGAISGDMDTFSIPGAALAYTAESDAVKEAITLNGPSSPATYTFSLATSTGLTPRQNAVGGIDFVTGSGQIPFSFAAPSMTDSAGATSRAVSLTLTLAASGWTVVLSADATWLADPTRSWPVVIDPTVVLQPATQDCYITGGGYANTNYCGSALLKVGYDFARIQRAMLLFTIPQSIPSTATVTNVDLALRLYLTANRTAKEVDIYQLTHSWTTGAMWNKYDGTNAWTTPGGDFSSTIAASNGSVGPTSNTWYHWYPTALVQSWVNGTAANDGMLLKEPVENSQDALYFNSSTFTIAANRPSLTITWGPNLGVLPWYTSAGGVNVSNGNLVTGGTDVSMGGVGLPTAVGRTYNDLSTGTGDFGNRWAMNSGADVGLQIAPDGSALLVGPTGYQVFFSRNADGSFTHPAGIDATLVKNGDGTYTLTGHANGEKLNFNSGGMLSTDVTSTGNTISYYYTGSLLTSIHDTLGQTTTLTYASPVSPNLISKITDAAGRTYQYGYDASKNLTSYTDPNNGTSQYNYDASGNLNTVTDPSGNVTTLAYDTSSRVTSITNVTDPVAGTGPTTTYAYNSGNTVVTDPDGHSTTYNLDSQGRVTSVTDPLSHTSQTTWNADNHVTQAKPPSGAATNYTYDSSNEKLTNVHLADGASTSAAYGNATWPYFPTTITDAQGNTSTITYNTNGTVASTTDAANGNVSYAYYANGSLASSTDENGHTTSHTYSNSNSGLPLQDTPPSPLGTTQYAFNTYNLESAVTDGNGKQTSFSYDLGGRLTAWTFADTTSVGYAYDADGNVTAMTDSTGTTSYTYNSLNELTSKTLPTGPSVSCPAGPGGSSIIVSVCYSYDAAGYLLAKQDGGGTISYGYDAAGEVTAATDRQGQPYTVGYDQDGNRTTIGFPNGVSEAMTYDGAGALTRISGAKGTSTLTSFSYSYTNPSSGAVTMLPYSVTDASNNTTSFTYDATNSLTQALQKNSGGSTLNTWSFGYDPAGNLTSKAVNGTNTTFNFNAADELTSASGGVNATYTYDGNGDRTSATSSGGTQQINLNAAGQITGVTPAGGTAVPYTYTGIGEQQRIGAGASTYQYDATGMSKQHDTLGDTYFTDLPDGTLLSEQVPSGSSAGTYYYLSDGAGNVAALTDSTGAVKNTYNYDPLGNAASTDSVPNPFTFQGGMYDSTIGYYYTGSGYYDPANGQSFGCRDKGRYDPGEDACGEDEGSQTYWFPLYVVGPAACHGCFINTGGRVRVVVRYLGHHRISIYTTVFAPPKGTGYGNGLVYYAFGFIQVGNTSACASGDTAAGDNAQTSLAFQPGKCTNLVAPAPDTAGRITVLFHITGGFCPYAAVGGTSGTGGVISCDAFYEHPFTIQAAG